MDTKIAYNVAIARGYQASQKAFTQWFRDNKDKSLLGITKHSDRGKYNIDSKNDSD